MAASKQTADDVVHQDAIPDASVIIAAWNAESFLEGSIETALAQTDVDVEVVIVDDESEDSTLKIARRWAAKDRRVTVLSTDRNRGPSAARNKAIAAAKGNWVAILDADDRFAPNRLCHLIACAQDKRADVVFDLFEEVDLSGTPIPGSTAPRYTEAKHWTLSQWVEENSPASRGGAMGPGYFKPLIRRSFLVENGLWYREALRNSEDYLLIAEILTAGGAVWTIPEVGYFYTRHTGSISYRIKAHHLVSLLREEEAVLPPDRPELTDECRIVLKRRHATLRNAIACEEAIGSLKEWRFFKVPAILARHPDAILLMWDWLKEVIAKRLHLRR